MILVFGAGAIAGGVLVQIVSPFGSAYQARSNDLAIPEVKSNGRGDFSKPPRNVRLSAIISDPGEYFGGQITVTGKITLLGSSAGIIRQAEFDTVGMRIDLSESDRREEFVRRCSSTVKPCSAQITGFLERSIYAGGYSYVFKIN